MLLSFFYFPALSKAQTCDSTVTDQLTCEQNGGTWDPGQSVPCQCPASGNLCANVKCSAGLTCNPVNGVCVPNGSAPQPGSGSPPPPSGPQPGSGSPPPPSSSGQCPQGFDSVSGLCVPHGNYSDGSIAGKGTLQELILAVLQYLLFFAGLIAVVALVIGGYWYLTAAGNEEQAEKGRKAILNAIIGLVVVILAYAIVNIVTHTLTSGSPTG